MTLADLYSLESDPEKKERFKVALVSRVENILKNDLVVNARGAFVGSYGNATRIENTATLLRAVTLVRSDVPDTDALAENMERFLIASKKPDGSFGSTRETSAVIRSLADVLSRSGDLRNAAFVGSLSLNENLVSESAFSGVSRFDVVEKSFDANDLPNRSEIVFGKRWNGRLFYDMALTHLIPAGSVASRDDGFYVESRVYDLNEYQRIKTLKQKEWQSYLNGDTELEALRYPHEPSEYLSEKTSFSVGDLAYVETRIVTPEARRQVAFESMIPSGSELVNAAFATETAQAVKTASVFDHEELRDDRYFASVSDLESGDYRVGYTLRFTHAGTFGFAPARAYEFVNAEVSGNGSGKTVTVTKR